MRRTDCHDAIKRVTSSYETAVRTVDVVIGIVVWQPGYLKDENLSLAELRLLGGELHDTYFTRMFASFEPSLRHYWRTEVRKTEPLTRVLLSSIASRLGVPQDRLDLVQEVREFRNHLISRPARSRETHHH